MSNLLLLILLSYTITAQAFLGGLFGKKNETKYAGHYKIGRPYTIKNKKYYPKKISSYNQVGVASWYGEQDGFHGKLTANGDTFDKNSLTAAHKTLPLPSMVRVTNLENKKSVIVMINDRGPFAKNRIIDLSEKTAEILGMRKKGTAKVRVRFLRHETRQLLKKLALKPKEGYLAKADMENAHCSVDCYLEQINYKYRYLKGKPNRSYLSSNGASQRVNRAATKKSLPMVSQGKKTFYIIKIGSYKNHSQANENLISLKHYAKGHVAHKGKNYELQFGPIRSKLHATKLAARLENVTGFQSIIVENAT